MAPRPKLLLLDEPLSALDYKLRKEMQVELKCLQHQTGVTFVFVTHDQDEALGMSDRIAVMDRGRVLQVGTPKDIYGRPANRIVANFIGESSFFDGTVGSVEAGRATVVLPSGATLVTRDAGNVTAGAAVTLAIRPEHAEPTLRRPGAGLAGTIETAVYRGTDTHYRVRLSDGALFAVRRQNADFETAVPETGAAVSVIVPNGLIQVLKS
ncbi:MULTISPECIES: ABC transporter ATP-binding protein [unclassified Rhizobium]|uniref:ABC transporter ATP-binding protein n=1 Tax=unclassified Rhizobium TaxID=2613769 RepID=UPI0006F3A55D|nr:hypothetical protein ASC86_20385 [Rhizobium sp. Root1212]KRD30020.1 hypothetical protein ASE37_23925 [Rhizobium sp. Root268]